MNWLFVTSTFPWPLAHGTHLRIYHLARTLAAQGDHITLAAGRADLPHDKLEQGRLAYRHMGVELLETANCQLEKGQESLQSAIRNPQSAIEKGQEVGKERANPYLHDAALENAVSNSAPAADCVVLFRPACAPVCAGGQRGQMPHRGFHR